MDENTLTIKPLSNRILIQPIKAEEKTNSGLYIPESAKTSQTKGIVIATGPGKMLDNGCIIPTEVKENNVVLYNKNGGQEITIDNKKYLIMPETEILAIIS